MRFEWSERKNRANFRKHGLWFEQAQKIWQDPFSLEFCDEGSSHREERYLKVGALANGLVLNVVFTEREAEASIRIISARRATRRERDTYEERIRSFQIEKA